MQDCPGSRRGERGKCGPASIGEGELLDQVVEVVEKHFASEEAQADMRRRLERMASLGEGSLAQRLKRLRRRLDDLDGKIAAAAERLLEVSAAALPDAEAALLRRRQEREEVAGELEEARRQQAQAAHHAELINEALDILTGLRQAVAEGGPSRLAGLLKSVVLRFNFKATPSGRKYATLAGGSVELLPEIAGCNGSVAPILVSVRKN